MLSIVECRALIPDGSSMSDDEVATVRDDLYGMAKLALESWELKKRKT